MSQQPIESKIERLKAIKSSYIVRALAFQSQGMASAAIPLFLEASRMEMELARAYRMRNDERNAEVSQLSAGSCLVHARQFHHARDVLSPMKDKFAEARDLLTECGEKEDEPLPDMSPGLQALVDLLVKKDVIQEREWAEAVRAV